MIPAEFEYLAPKSLDEAIRMLERHGDEVKILAGGHSLLPLMKLRLAQPRYVVDIGRLNDLRNIREENGRISIGALVTHAEVGASPLLRAECPLLPETAVEIGDMQVRNRGTIGGSLAHADPAADYPAAVLALNAEIVAVSSSGQRSFAARDFFVDLMATQLRPGEVIVAIRVPVQSADTGAAYRKLRQPASGYAVVGVAAVVRLAGDGAIDNAKIGVTGLAVKAFRATAAEESLRGKKPTAENLTQAARLVAEGVDALADIHASAEYRREMAAVFARRALEAAIAAAKNSAAARRA
jgi:aerobic carbon-monoxide dehydrogenase medium subunit